MNHTTPADSSISSAIARTGPEPHGCTSCRKCRHENEPCSRAQRVGGPELSIAQAIDFTLYQRELLNTAAILLDRIVLVAPAAGAAAVDEDFSALALKLDEIARAQFQGGPVFNPSVTLVKVDNSGNKLVIPGVDLGARVLRRFTSFDPASSPADLLAVVNKAKDFLDLDHAMVNECFARLTFLAKDLDAVKDSLAGAKSPSAAALD